MFTGLIELKEINLSKLDNLFLNTSRIKGNIDLSLSVPDPIGPVSYTHLTLPTTFGV